MLLNINDLLGKPYKLNGRGPAYYDCFGLVIEVEKRLGHHIKDVYAECKKGEKSKSRDVDFSSQQIGVKKVATPSFGDIVAFFDTKERINHVGIFLKDNDVLHCNNDGVHISKIESFTKKKEFYTWQK